MRTTTVAVVAGAPSEFVFTLSPTTVPVGPVRFTVTNAGRLSHAFRICSSPAGGAGDACAGPQTAAIAPGRSATLRVLFAAPGTYEYLCAVPGQAAAGMKGILRVVTAPG